MTEADLTRRIIRRIKREASRREMGLLIMKIHGGPNMPRGLPDLAGCLEGDFFGLEVKVPGKEDTLTDLQAKKLRDIKAAGGISDMVTSPKQAVEVLFP